MTTNTKSQTSRKANSFYKFLAILAILAVIGTLIAALVMMFTSLGLGGGDFNFERMKISSYMLYGVAGAIPLILMPSLFLWIFSKRKVIMSNLKSSMKVRGIGPYAANYQHPGVNKARFCEYCGYEVRSGERECPECGGPVRKLDI